MSFVSLCACKYQNGYCSAADPDMTERMNERNLIYEDSLSLQHDCRRRISISISHINKALAAAAWGWDSQQQAMCHVAVAAAAPAASAGYAGGSAAGAAWQSALGGTAALRLGTPDKLKYRAACWGNTRL